MASNLEFAEFVCDQMSGVRGVSHRRMFGEFAIYVGEKVVALVCDNQLFIKPTDAGRELLGEPTEAPPYPGAKPHFLIEGQLDDQEFMAALITATARALPVPTPKKKSAKQVAKAAKATKTSAKKGPKPRA